MNGSPKETAADEVVRALREKMRDLETDPVRRRAVPIGVGCAALDRCLPGGGVLPGTLIEWLAPCRGSGAALLALLAARAVCRDGAALVVVDRDGQFYPPAAAALGIDLQRMILVRPNSPDEHRWALDQALRCQVVGAVWTAIDRLDARTFRRLQLAAEQSGTVGLLLRNAAVRGRPSWAEVQLLVQPRTASVGRRLYVEVVRARGAAAGRGVLLQIDEQTGAMRAVASPGGTGISPVLGLGTTQKQLSLLGVDKGEYSRGATSQRLAAD